MNPEQSKAVLKVADKDLILSVCKFASNLLKCNVTVNAKRKRKLAQYKNILRKLVRKGESFKVKKKFLIQKGGGGVLLPILLSTEL